MKHILTTLLLISLLGCVTPGSDPVVVESERVTALAVETFDTFLQFEYQTREIVKNEDMHKVADVIRKNGIHWLQTARNMTKAYKQNRSPENKANLNTAIAILTQAMKEVTGYLPKEN